MSGVGALWDCVPRVCGGGGGCAGGGVPLGPGPMLSWCGEVSLGGGLSSSSNNVRRYKRKRGVKRRFEGGLLTLGGDEECLSAMAAGSTAHSPEWTSKQQRGVKMQMACRHVWLRIAADRRVWLGALILPLPLLLLLLRLQFDKRGTRRWLWTSPTSRTRLTRAAQARVGFRLAVYR